MLIQRLNEIAAPTGGEVLLHGRLFAQWMHHAFPRECPYPHVAGTTNPRTTKEFWNETGTTYRATKGDMEQFIDAMGPQRSPATPEAEGDDDDVLLPWKDEEELLVSQPFGVLPTKSSSVAWSAIRIIVFASAVGSLAYSSMRSALSAMHVLTNFEAKKCNV